jgi:hypothetical protein
LALSVALAVIAGGAEASEPLPVGFSQSPVGRRQPLRLLFDEYHHFPRSAQFSQGFSLDPEAFERTYFYAADATGHPNGLFALTQVLRRDFRTASSTEPIGPDLADRADAYMLICPERGAVGNPHPITAADAAHLEAFVRSGGILILVHNSVADPQRDSLDLAGMNLVASRFGLEFLAKTTRTISIPIPRDHPVFFGVRGILYGNGTTIRVHPQADARATVLLESSNPEVPGAVAVRVRFDGGTVLALGDAGTLGNGNMARDDVGQPDAVAQLFHCLLPDGPLPAYGWKEGLKLQVRLRDEMAASAYPEVLRCLDLPLDAAARVLIRMPRALDVQSARPDKSSPAETAKPAAETAKSDAEMHKNRFLLARASWDLDAELEIQAFDGRTFAACWAGPDGAELACRLTPRGELLDPAAEAGELDSWRWALLNEVFVNPLDGYAQPGDEWDSPVMMALPQAQLQQVSTTHRATGHFRFEGRQSCRGRSCFLISKSVDLPLDDVRPQDLVAPQYAANFDQMNVQFRVGRQTCVVKTWVDEVTRLPVKTVARWSAVFWWTDRSADDQFISDHDHVSYEHRLEQRRVMTIGRLLVAEFD